MLNYRSAPSMGRNFIDDHLEPESRIYVEYTYEDKDAVQAVFKKDSKYVFAPIYDKSEQTTYMDPV